MRSHEATECMCDVFAPRYAHPDAAVSDWHAMRCPYHGERLRRRNAERRDADPRDARPAVRREARRPRNLLQRLADFAAL